MPDDPLNALTDDEREIVQAYRAMTPQQRERLWSWVDHPNDAQYVVLSFAGVCALGLGSVVVGLLVVVSPILNRLPTLFR